MARTSGTTISMIMLGWIGFFMILVRKSLGTPMGIGTVTSTYLFGVPSTVLQWRPTVMSQAGTLGLNPDFVLAVIWQESYGLSEAVGAAGEIGLMQVLPSTAAIYGVPSAQDLFIPAVNLRVGMRYLDFCFENTSDTYGALRAYNAGLSGSRANPRAGAQYANDVLNKFNGTQKLDYSTSG